VLIGNATDVPALQSNVLVTTNHDRRGSAWKPKVNDSWEHRELFQACLTLDGPSTGQSNHGRNDFLRCGRCDRQRRWRCNAILKGLLDDGFQQKSLVPIVDAAVARFSSAWSGMQDFGGGTR
jgi:hypothetical protein